MGSAVAMVQAYLNVNGYFTVVEYPVMEAYLERPARTATDLDLLAFRFLKFPKKGMENEIAIRRAGD